MYTERSLLMRITPALMLALCLPLAAQEQRSPLANPNEFRPGVLRTPAERFENLQGYPFESNYMEVRVERGVGGQERAPMRMHYVDEGSGDPVLMLHGVPSWSYLFRKMIPPIAENHRVIAPDWIGFGKSDKFIRESDYSFRMHLDSAIAFVEALDLHNVTLVMQDWGGFIGLPLVAAIPDRFARLVLMNTALPTGYGMMTENWYAVRNRFRLQANSGGVRQFAIGGITDPEIIRAYTAPFPDPSYYAGINVFPQLVPILPDDPMAPTMLRTAEFLTTWYRPALVMFSDGDQVLGPHQHWLRRLIPSAMDEPVITIEGAGHFLQENKGEEVAEHILEFFQRHPLD